MTTNPTRRLILAGASLLPALSALPAFAQARKAVAPALSAADQASVAKAVAYLQGLSAAKGRFTQISPRGQSSGGDFYLQRPGKVRFVYDAPQKLVLVSDGNQVAVVDGRLGTYEAYPLRVTPLALFLAKEIRLDRGVVVSSVTRGAGTFTINATDRNGETKGAIAMTFSENPVALKEWTTTDAQRGKTRVVLNSLAPASGLDRTLFTLPKDPRPRAPSKGGGL